MSAALRIHLVRHPQPAVATGICYGQTDLGLAEPATAAAERLRSVLPTNARVISSPLQRCLDLAEALATEVETDRRLLEINFGDWEGRSWDEIPRQQLDAWAAAPFEHVPPGGESAAAMAVRVIAFAADLVAAANTAATTDRADLERVLVAHQGPLRVLLAHWLDLPRESWLKLHLDFATASCIELSPAGNRLLWLNR
ncbi:MAG TPA: alpha-ribazole phosphatase family protein [Rhodocyclaceae bacterium]|nr:alpha-ribazole phosphatase family protein [Rhodocyclaceae bacterium]